jgi:hypothetical protein
MATQGKGASVKRKASVPVSDYSFSPVYVAPPKPLNQDWESVIGYILCCLLLGILLPIMGMLYVDILVAKHEVKQQQEQVQKLINKAKEK